MQHHRKSLPAGDFFLMVLYYIKNIAEKAGDGQPRDPEKFSHMRRLEAGSTNTEAEEIKGMSDKKVRIGNQEENDYA